MPLNFKTGLAGMNVSPLSQPQTQPDIFEQFDPLVDLKKTTKELENRLLRKTEEQTTSQLPIIDFSKMQAPVSQQPVYGQGSTSVPQFSFENVVQQSENTQPAPQETSQQAPIIPQANAKLYDQAKIEDFVKTGREAGLSNEILSQKLDEAMQTGLFDITQPAPQETPQKEPFFQDLHPDESIGEQALRATYRAPLEVAKGVVKGAEQFVRGGMNVSNKLVGSALNELTGDNVEIPAFLSDEDKQAYLNEFVKKYEEIHGKPPEQNEIDDFNKTISTTKWKDLTDMTAGITTAMWNALKAPASLGLGLASELPGTQYGMQAVSKGIEKGAEALAESTGMDTNVAHNVITTGMNTLGLKGIKGGTLEMARGAKTGFEKGGIPGAIKSIGKEIGRETKQAVAMPFTMPLGLVKGAFSPIKTARGLAGQVVDTGKAILNPVETLKKAGLPNNAPQIQNLNKAKEIFKSISKQKTGGRTTVPQIQSQQEQGFNGAVEFVARNPETTGDIKEVAEVEIPQKLQEAYKGYSDTAKGSKTDVGAEMETALRTSLSDELSKFSPKTQTEMKPIVGEILQRFSGMDSTGKRTPITMETVQNEIQLLNQDTRNSYNNGASSEVMNIKKLAAKTAVDKANELLGEAYGGERGAYGSMKAFADQVKNIYLEKAKQENIPETQVIDTLGNIGFGYEIMRHMTNPGFSSVYAALRIGKTGLKFLNNPERQFKKMIELIKSSNPISTGLKAPKSETPEATQKNTVETPDVGIPAINRNIPKNTFKTLPSTDIQTPSADIPAIQRRFPLRPSGKSPTGEAKTAGEGQVMTPEGESVAIIPANRYQSQKEVQKAKVGTTESNPLSGLSQKTEKPVKDSTVPLQKSEEIVKEKDGLKAETEIKVGKPTTTKPTLQEIPTKKEEPKNKEDDGFFTKEQDEKYRKDNGIPDGMLQMKKGDEKQFIVSITGGDHVENYKGVASVKKTENGYKVTMQDGDIGNSTELNLKDSQIRSAHLGDNGVAVYYHRGNGVPLQFYPKGHPYIEKNGVYNPFTEPLDSKFGPNAQKNEAEKIEDKISIANKITEAIKNGENTDELVKEFSNVRENPVKENTGKDKIDLIQISQGPFQGKFQASISEGPNKGKFAMGATEEQAKSNLDDVIAGKEVKREPTVKTETKNPLGGLKKPVKSNTNKLRETADSVISKAEETLGASRNENTNRRASMADNARERARQDLALGNTMKLIADAIDSGNTEKMSNVSSKQDVSRLQSAINVILHRYIRDKNINQRDLERNPQKVTDEMIDRYTETPGRVYHHVSGSDMNSIFTPSILRAGTMEGLDLKTLKEELKRGNYINVLLFENEISFLASKGKGNNDFYQIERLKESLTDEKALKKISGGNTQDEVEIGLKKALKEYNNIRNGVSTKETKEEQLKREERDLAMKTNIPGFFPTPEKTVSEMIDIAQIKPGMKVLEPSAGLGHIADKIKEKGVNPDVIELNNSLSSHLEKKGHNVIGSDFMELPENAKYDRIIMNPPFEKLQDTEHVMKAYDHLNPGGRIVSIMGEGAFGNSLKKASDFREWLDSVGGTSEKLPEGTFKESLRQTGVNTRMVIIDKPKENTSETGKPAERQEENGNTGNYTPKERAKNPLVGLKNIEPKGKNNSEYTPQFSPKTENAFNWTSFDPRRRENSSKEEYKRDIDNAYKELLKESGSPEKQKILDELMPEFEKRYVSALNAYYSSHGRLASPMIAGPAKFPFAKMEKLDKTVSNKLTEANEIYKKGISYIKKKMNGIDTEGISELEQMKAKLEEETKQHEYAIAYNKIIKSKSDISDKIEEVKRLTGKNELSKDMVEIITQGETVPSFTLTNSRNRIKHYEQRVKELSQKEILKTEQEETGEAKTEKIGNIELVHNAEADRIQMKFEGKPDEETRAKLRGRGFLWSPKHQAWQRKLTKDGIYYARKLANEFNGTEETKNPLGGLGKK